MRERDAGAWRILATAGLVVAGVANLSYAAWALTARRSMYADIADAAAGNGAVPLSAARGSDAVDAGWSAAAGLLLAVALLLWAAARVLGRQRLGTAGFAGLALVGVGLLVVAAGTSVAATAGGDPSEAGRVALGCTVVGIGFLLTGLGPLTGAAALLRGDRPPYLGYAGWRAG